MDHASPRLALRETAPQLFSLWSDDALATQSTVKVLSTRDTAHAGWTVSMSALEVVRATNEATAPLPRNVIVAEGLQSSRLHARVSWMQAGQGTSIDLDIGTGFRLCIEGCGLEVAILGPDGNIRETAKDDARRLGAGGIYLDTLLSGQALGVVTDPALPNTLTQSFIVPAGEALALPLPRFAKRLQAFAPQGPFEALHFHLGQGGPLVADWAFRWPHTTGDGVLPQCATHLTTGDARPQERRLTLVWTLEL